MNIEVFVYQGLSILSYLVIDEAAKLCAVIDAPRLINPIKEYIQSHKLTLVAVLETHVHADFVSGAIELKDTFGQKPLIYCSAEGGDDWLPDYADHPIYSGDAIAVGSITLKALHTPGHTPEHLTWLCFDKEHGSDPFCAFTGDFLFVQGVGRPDLLGSSLTEKLLADLYTSLFDRIASIPDATHLFPSHGAGSLCGKAIGGKQRSTFGEERRDNAALRKQPLEVWKTGIQKEMPSPPKTFARNKKINKKGASLLRKLPPISTSIVDEDIPWYFGEGQVIDFRDTNSFAKAHLKGAINIPLAPAVGNWLAGLLPEEIPLLCVVPNEKDKLPITGLIRTLGYDQPITAVLWDEHWNGSQFVESLVVVDGKKLKELLIKPDHLYLIDVRTPEEWNAAHIQEAHSIELNDLEKTIPKLPKDKRLITICASGGRSSIAASLLKSRGFEVSNLAGGMNAWNQDD